MEHNQFNHAILEILLNIGNSFNIKEAANETLTSYMQQLDLAGAVLYEKTSVSTYFSHTMKPKNLKSNLILLEIINDLKTNNDTIQAECFDKMLPYIKERNGGYYYLYELKNFGLLLCIKNLEQLSEKVHKPLRQLNLKFATSLIACKNLIELRENEKLIQRQSQLSLIGEIAAGVGHEINNPLAIAAGFINRIKKSLEKEKLSNKNTIEDIKKVEMANERIRNIVDGLRTYARAIPNQSEIIYLKDVIDNTMMLISEIYTKESVLVILGEVDSELFVRGNLGKVQQVIMNLISNAKDATQGRKERKIFIDLKRKGESNLVLSVRDNGVGIPEEIKDKILNPFFTTKGAGKGTGMGLGLVNEFVIGLKGELLIKSRAGEGSTFSVMLPLASKVSFDSQETQKLQASQNLEQSHTKKLKGRALVVDDEEGIRELLVEHLEDMGFEVEQADDGDTALEKIKQSKFDFVCTDMKMQRMQGWELIKEGRKLSYGDIFYFIITGGVSISPLQDKDSELEKLGDGYIRKPFTEESILEMLTSKMKLS